MSLALELFQARVREAEVVDERPFLTARDMVTVRLGFDDGRECLIDVNRCALDRKKRINLLTASGNAYLWEDETLYSVAGDDRPTPVYSNSEEPLTLELSAFLDSIDGEAAALGDGQHASEVVGVLERLLHDGRR